MILYSISQGRFYPFFSLLVLMVGLLLCSDLTAGIKVGTEAPKWKDLPATDGKKYSSSDFSAKPYLLVVFTCNSCPCAQGYENRLNQLVKKFEKDLSVVAINVNKVPEDKMDKMVERAKKQGFLFPYLQDESQDIARQFGATFTPECYLLDKERKVIYTGAIDNKDNENEVSETYLENALNSHKAGKPIEKASTQARGCLIRYSRNLKDR